MRQRQKIGDSEARPCRLSREPLLRALQQLHEAGSPIGPEELAALHTIVAAAIEHDMHVQNTGRRDALESYRAGQRLFDWIQLLRWLESFE